MLENLFGELANDLSIKSLMQKFGRFSFDSTSQLRTVTSGSVSVTSGSVSVSSGSVSVSSGTVTTVTTCTTANMSIGDMGKPATAILQSAQGFYGTVGANFIRS